MNAPVIAQDGYTFPRSWWDCRECFHRFVVFGGTPDTLCPNCGGEAIYGDGMLVDMTAQDYREHHPGEFS
jgi:rRNA maturation endonuclease Nob1